ncbi:ABC transporter [Betaproteobacteria bacterium]|nr:ABC transporter [Betaproteobacteria bacterium]GHU11025.1 ABC transporter [Betaproteobacteria bacterium]GHU20102.1 ABC transporter [Betaproteobacteria bacterium]
MSAPRTLIRLQGVGKSYPTASTVGARLRTLGALLAGRPLPVAFHALTSIDLEVHAGESLGIIGVNGAGKSTLLKAITGVVHPSCGQITLAGRVSALLELGAGFHPEHTGRQNIFLAAALMGLPEHEIRARVPDILAFADIGEHIDQPLKHYSSGMVVRLGFAVATCVAPDILITDEILSVGDESFQRKCSAWMENYLAGGGTLLLCSHILYHIEKLCRHAAWIHDGRIRAYGEASAVCREYIAWHEARQVEEKAPAAPAATVDFNVVKHLTLNGSAEETFTLAMGEALEVAGTVFAPDGRAPAVAIGIVKADGQPVYGTVSDIDGYQLQPLPAPADRLFAFTFVLPELDLLPGHYEVRAHAMDAEGYRLFDAIIHRLVVTGTSRDMGVYRLPHYWR